MSTSSRGRGPELGGVSRTAGQVTVVLAVVAGFDVLFDRLPASLPLLVPLTATVCVLLAPRTLRRALRVTLPLLGLLVWAALSWVWSVNPDATLGAVRDELLPVAALVPVVGVLRPADLAAGVRWAVRVVLVTVVLALLTRPDTRTSGSAEFLVEGWRGSFPDKNSLALWLLLALASTLALDRGASRVLTCGVIGVLLVGAQSATGLSGALLLLVVAGFLHELQRRSARETALLVLGGATVLAAFVLGAVSNLTTVLQVYGRDADLTGRTDIWAAVLRETADRPLVGFGLDGLLDVFDPSPVTLRLWDDIGFPAVHAHNGALDLVGQIGLVGLVLVTAVLVQLLRVALQDFRSPVSGTLDEARWVLLLLPSLLLVSATEPVLGGAWWLVLVLLSAPLLRARPPALDRVLPLGGPRSAVQRRRLGDPHGLRGPRD